MATGDSWIGRATTQLLASMDLAEEGLIHATEANARATDAFALYRQALGESTSPSAAEAIDGTTTAMQLMSEARTSLAAAREAIASYIAHISPGAAPGSKVVAQIAPDGEKLLDLSRRPRNRRQLRAEATRQVSDLTGVVDAGLGGAKKVVGALRPPEITGAHGGVDVHQPPASPSPLPTDAFSAMVISGMVIVQATTYAAGRAGRAIRRLFRNSEG